MSERMSFKMQRLELRKKHLFLEDKAKDTLSNLRKILNPAIPLASIREDDAMDTLAVLVQQVVELRGIESQLAVLNAELEG